MIATVASTSSVWLCSAKGNFDRSTYGGVGAVSVFVDTNDEAAARAILDDADRALPIDPADGEHYIDPDRRRRFGLVLLAAFLAVPVLAVAIDAFL